MTEFNKTEQEVIVLYAVWMMIDDMVNYDMFMKLTPKDTTFTFNAATTLTFNTDTHQRLFNILLVDFLSQPQPRNKKPLPFDLPRPPKSPRLSDRTHLFYLRTICEDAKLGTNVDLIRKPLEAFSVWLEANVLVENVYFPSIETQLDIRTPRISFLKICGNIAKHNFVRLDANVKEICKILKDNEKPIDEKDGYLLLPEFYEKFHDSVLNYHASTIAEFLNNIRWAIFEYLQPEFKRSFEKIDTKKYRYQFPEKISQPVAKAMYWDLMNKVRRPPYFPRVTVPDIMKCRY